MFGILKLGRVLRINKIISYMNVDEDIKASMKLSKIIFYLTIYIHFFTCVLWIVAKDQETWWPYSVVGLGILDDFYDYSP